MTVCSLLMVLTAGLDVNYGMQDPLTAGDFSEMTDS